MHSPPLERVSVWQDKSIPNARGASESVSVWYFFTLSSEGVVSFDHASDVVGCVRCSVSYAETSPFNVTKNTIKDTVKLIVQRFLCEVIFHKRCSKKKGDEITCVNNTSLLFFGGGGQTNKSIFLWKDELSSVIQKATYWCHLHCTKMSNILF